MKKTILYIFFLTLAFIINCHQYSLSSMNEADDMFKPIETCTEGRSIEVFLSEFRLEKVNKIVLKEQLDEDTIKPKTITTITNKKNIKSILKAINNVKCLDDFILSACGSELWLYENNTLLLKVAMSVGKNNAVVRFFRPDQKSRSNIGINDFFITDENFCSWLYSLFGLEKYEDPDWEDKE